MDLAATQIYEEEIECTQRISSTLGKKDLVQVGILSIDSTEYKIKSGTTTIGRESTCDIFINDLTVSGTHAEIEADGGQDSTWICDLHSTNKTKLNNLELRPERMYELKDGSVIKFGKVCAVYRTYRPTDDVVIPETPAPTRQNTAKTIIPNTPDSSINNSSTADDDGSIILGTQTEKGKSIFQRPLLPLQRQSTSIDKKNTSRGASINEGDDSQIDIRLHVSVNDSSGTEGVSIFDMETQKNEESRKIVASSSIRDMETQNFPTNVSKLSEANATANKQLSKLDLRGKMAGNSAIGISDMETQNCTDTNEQQHPGKSEPNTIAKKSMTNIHDLETQNYIVDTAKNIRDAPAKKSTANIHDLETQNYIVDTAKNIRDAPAEKSTTNIHDLETQKYIVDAAKNIRDAPAKKSTTNIHDLETQNYLVDAAKNNNASRKTANNENKFHIPGVDRVEHDIHDLETQKPDNECTVEDICDMETQIAPSRAGKNNGYKNNDMPDVVKSGPSCENVTKLPSSRSSSPGLLNLSSPEINEDYPLSPLNQSAHLLESSDLLEYFGDGIDQSGGIRQHNASTPKPRSKTSSHKDNAGNTADASDNENDNEVDNIHDLPTQRNSSKLKVYSPDSETNKKKEVVKCKALKKASEKSRPKQINDDSETDAEEYLEELAKKQSGSLEASSKMHDANEENKNDSDTTVDSDDMFDMLTQQPKNHSAKTTSNSPINQPSKTIQSDAVVDDMAPTQKKKAEDKRGRDDRSHVSSVCVDDAAPTQLLLPRKASSKATISSKNSSLKNNRNDVDDTVPTRIVHANIEAFDAIESDNRRSSPNLDCEDIDYETAPTQVIGEVAEKRDSTRRTSDRAKAAKSTKVDLNDTLERNLKELFEDVNDDSIQEGPLMSTQCLEEMLQSSQCDDSSNNKTIVNEQAPSANTLSKSGRKSNRFSRNVTENEANKNNVDDSQNSDAYFATITSKRKKNIIKDTQELINSAETLISSCEVPNLPRKSKEKTKDEAKEKTKDEAKNSVPTKSDKKGKKIAKSKKQADATTDILTVSKEDTVNKTISSEKKTVQKTKLVKQKDGTFALKTNKKKVLEKDSCEADVDHAEGNLVSGLDACAPCPSSSRQDAQTSSTLCESDDDILTRLPAVRMSGTLSNPSSPSVSSTSTVRSSRSKRSVAKGKQKDEPSKSKSLRKRNVEEPSRANNKSLLPSGDNHSSNVNVKTLTTNKESESMNNSEDSDSATSYRRLKQIADRMFGSTQGYQEKLSKKRNVPGSSKSVVSDKKKGTSSSSPVNSNHSSDLKESENPVRTNSKPTCYSDRLNNKAHAKSVTDKPKTRATSNRKRGPNTIEASTEQTDSKKHKADPVTEEAPASRRSKRVTARTNTDRHSPNIIEEFTEARTRENSPVIGNAESSASRKAATSKTKENIDVAKSSVTRNKHKINNSSAKSTMDENSNRDKRTQAKEKETLVIAAQEKTLKIVLNPIIVDDESREVEMIMMKKPPSDLSIREGSNVSILQKASRNTRSRKRANTSAITDSSSIESSASSDTSDRESVQSGGITLRRSKRGRSAKDAVPPLQVSPVSEKNDVFKRPVSINRYSTNSTVNVVGESSTSNDNQNNSGSDASLNIRLSRSKTAGVKNTWEVQMNENTRRSRTENASVSSVMNASVSSIMNTSISSVVNTSVNSSLRVSTPSRARRSTSSMSISSPSAAKHRILFTGITEDKYNKVIKTLGGSKVDDPNKCTVLVTDKIRRTYKFLCALAKGVPIVSIDWLNDSESEAQFLDWENYILKDPAAEAKFGFRLRKSLDRAKEKGLLVGYTIVLTPNVAPPPTEELKDMVVSCGGRALSRPPNIWPEKALIISREEDLPNAKKYLAKAPKTVTIQSTEFILTGILRQEVDFDKYRLT